MGFLSLRLATILAVCAVAAGCATAPHPRGSYPVKIGAPAPGIEITDGKARVERYGLVVTGHIHIAARLPAPAVHSVDIVLADPGGHEIRKFTSQYFPTPKSDRKKPQTAHFTMVTYAVPPDDSVVQISLTPQPKPDQPGQLAPENR